MKIQLLFLFLLSSTIFYGQNVNIPDPSFKQALLNQGFFGRPHIDTNSDGEIQVTEALAVDSLIVGDAFVNQGIQDMAGIEAFENITYLICYNNQINNLDLSQNTALKELDCQENQLTSLDLSYQTSLEYLDCKNNQLIFLDIRNGNNQNISNTDFRPSSNPSLTCIFVDDKTYSQNNWSLIDPNSHFVETQQECDDLGLGSSEKLEIKLSV